MSGEKRRKLVKLTNQHLLRSVFFFSEEMQEIVQIKPKRLLYLDVEWWQRL